MSRGLEILLSNHDLQASNHLTMFSANADLIKCGVMPETEKYIYLENTHRNPLSDMSSPGSWQKSLVLEQIIDRLNILKNSDDYGGIASLASFRNIALFLPQ